MQTKEETVKQINEIAKEQVKPDIVLQMKVSATGGMSWEIPTDLKMATFMLKFLDTCVSKMTESYIAQLKASNPANRIIK